MSRGKSKKRTEGKKVLEEVEAFIFSVLLELDYGDQSFEDAVRSAMGDWSRKGLGVVKQYMRHLEEDEHNAADLDRALKAAARRGGYIVEGDARGFLLHVGKILKQAKNSPPGSHHKTRKG